MGDKRRTHPGTRTWIPDRVRTYGRIRPPSTNAPPTRARIPERVRTWFHIWNQVRRAPRTRAVSPRDVPSLRKLPPGNPHVPPSPRRFLQLSAPRHRPAQTGPPTVTRTARATEEERWRTRSG